MPNLQNVTSPFPVTRSPCPSSGFTITPVFFLNTLGGRSYMLRRESKLRMLVSYYAILIVDRANDEKFNRYGIDVPAVYRLPVSMIFPTRKGWTTGNAT